MKYFDYSSQWASPTHLRGRPGSWLWSVLCAFSLMLMLALPAQAQGGQTDTTATSPSSKRSSWITRPPTGQSEKIQGTLLVVAGGALAGVGVYNMNREDPCDGVGGRNVTCISNLEEVQTVGAIQLGLGAASALIGMVRVGVGMRKARKYEQWKKQNLALSPVVRYDGHQMQYGMTLYF